jgi:SET domain-containing protein
VFESYLASRLAKLKRISVGTARIDAKAIVKRLLHNNIKVRRGAHGLGLFATGPIKKGDVVAEYWGPIVTEEEVLRSRGKYFFELSNNLAINGKYRSNVARYINHSCKPNCEPVETSEQRIFICAKRTISPVRNSVTTTARNIGTNI